MPRQVVTMTIGLTGGIAAGKSTACHRLAARDRVEAFDADKCVHELLENDRSVAQGIVGLFGPRSCAPDGKPDRAALRELVFRDAEARRKLEDLLHPLVRARWNAERERCLAARKDFLADIPLLYETGAEQLFDAVVVVACSRETQLDRLNSRGVAEETAQAMLASQLPLGQKVTQADFVIWNDGSLAAFGRQTELVAQQLFPD